MSYSKQILVKLKNIVILCKNLENTSGFYSEGLGLKVINQSKQIVELKDKSDNRIILKQIQNLSQNLKGYSPIINFEVEEEFDSIVEKMKSYEVQFDGEIVDNEQMKMCLFQGPNGEFISLLQEKEKFNSDDEIDGEEGEGSKTNQEIQRILKKIKF